MRVCREPFSKASRTRHPGSALGRISTGVVVATAGLAVALPTSLADATSQVTAPRVAAPTPHRTATPARSAQLVRAATPHAVRPVVRELAVPSVPASASARISKASGSRSALTGSQAASDQLVAHVRSAVRRGTSMVGVTWTHGSVDASAVKVAVRVQRSTRTGTTAWSPWSTLEVDPSEGPSAQEDSTLRDGTVPVFVGERATAVEVDVYTNGTKTPGDLTVAAIDPGTSSYDATAAKAGATATTASTRDAFPAMPRVVTRKQWGADESLGDPCWAPRYGNQFKAVFVHHTAGSNSYTRRESPSVVRGIYAYHTQSRHWCDIGYNFLVDKYGTVYEGRAGGIRKPVRGAHAGDYNVNSTGISLMGEFTSVSPTREMRVALIKLVAWRLGVAYHDGLGHVRLNGATFKAISGHRDAMSTSCPGQMVYDWLPTLRRKVHNRLDHFRSPIKRFWLKTGGNSGRLGPVRIGETSSDAGRHTTFAHARTYFKNGVRATLMAGGPVLTKYVRSGETHGPLGYPASKLAHLRKGQAMSFEHGGLYWSSATQAHYLVSSKVLRRYRHLGGPTSRLGFPETGVQKTKKGQYTRFRHGSITYDKATGRTTVSYR